MTNLEKTSIDRIYQTLERVENTLQQFNGKVAGLERHGDLLQNSVNLIIKTVNGLVDVKEQNKLRDDWMFTLATTVGTEWRKDFETFKKDVLEKIELLQKKCIAHAESLTNP